jgi:hypothetical protein
MIKLMSCSLATAGAVAFMALSWATQPASAMPLSGGPGAAPTTGSDLAVSAQQKKKSKKRKQSQEDQIKSRIKQHLPQEYHQYLGGGGGAGGAAGAGAAGAGGLR